MDKLQVLKTYFGHDGFRPGQEALIDALTAGRDVLGVMPTGAGKSMCYQIPAMLRSGTALVISPLISLMKDQVSALKSAGIPAAYLNSSLTPGQMDKAMQNAARGDYRIIYVAPERLDTGSFRRLTAAMPLSLLAVDEAHCVSQWGQDFRPNYLKIADFVASLPVRPPVGAFTATATQRVKDDILRLLVLQSPVCASTGFDRPNLYFEVLRPRKRFTALMDILREKPFDSVIVYCATRKSVEEVCDKLQAEGISAARYHAGLSDEERHRSQEDFQFDNARVMVATNAFGMGIDKSNVRCVVHYNMPRSMEAYYQEAGRAGRDGDEAECILLYSGQDVITGKYLINHSEPNPDLSPAAQAEVKRGDLRRLQQMIDWATSTTCLRRGILRYFGEDGPADCGNCSVCAGKRYAGAEETLSEPRRRLPVRDSEDTPIPLDQLGVPQIRIPEPKRRPQRKDLSLQEDETLFEALRACRSRLARQANLPAYIILPDTALHDMALRRPQNLNAMLDVKGMGTVKVSRYGDDFLAAIRAWKSGAAPVPAEKTVSAAPAVPAQAGIWPAVEEQRLKRGYQAGITVAQLAQLHQRSEKEIRDALHRLGLVL